MLDAGGKWAKNVKRAAENFQLGVRGYGISVQCAGCGKWTDHATITPLGCLCDECAEGYRAIRDNAAGR
jgi:hypothetical protein